MGDKNRGLYSKFVIQRTDGSSLPGGKHVDCDYFVLDLSHDPHAIAALRAYADSCAHDYPQLAADLRNKLRQPGAGARVAAIKAWRSRTNWSLRDSLALLQIPEVNHDLLAARRYLEQRGLYSAGDLWEYRHNQEARPQSNGNETPDIHRGDE